ncbi:MAG: hypothetical protein EXR06_04280 [Rickettsiales bacterium]|nr:hypothetical protein [Rickettsiales bacterium]
MYEENQKSLLLIHKIHNIISVGTSEDHDPLHMIEKIISCVESFTERRNFAESVHDQPISPNAAIKLRQRSAAPRLPDIQTDNAINGVNSYTTPPPY